MKGCAEPVAAYLASRSMMPAQVCAGMTKVGLWVAVAETVVPEYDTRSCFRAHGVTSRLDVCGQGDGSANQGPPAGLINLHRYFSSI